MGHVNAPPTRCNRQIDLKNGVEVSRDQPVAIIIERGNEAKSASRVTKTGTLKNADRDVTFCMVPQLSMELTNRSKMANSSFFKEALDRVGADGTPRERF
jgi:hypothetical protein